MNDDQHNTEKPIKKFRIERIEKTDPPEDASGGEWYRFSIGHETSPIEGIRSGTLLSVEQHLEEYLERLNARALYGYSARAAKTVKK